MFIEKHGGTNADFIENRLGIVTEFLSKNPMAVELFDPDVPISQNTRRNRGRKRRRGEISQEEEVPDGFLQAEHGEPGPRSTHDREPARKRRRQSTVVDEDDEDDMKKKELFEKLFAMDPCISAITDAIDSDRGDCDICKWKSLQKNTIRFFDETATPDSNTFMTLCGEIAKMVNENQESLQDEAIREATAVDVSIHMALHENNNENMLLAVARSRATIAKSLIYNLTVHLSADEVKRLQLIISDTKDLVNARKRNNR